MSAATFLNSTTPSWSFSRTSSDFCRIDQDSIQKQTSFIKSIGSWICLFLKHAAFLDFQIVHTTATTPTATKHLSFFPKSPKQMLGVICCFQRKHTSDHIPNQSGNKTRNKQMFYSFITTTELALGILPFPSPYHQVILSKNTISQQQPNKDFHSWWNFELSKLTELKT